jgi:hypothetical protein
MMWVQKGKKGTRLYVAIIFYLSEVEICDLVSVITGCENGIGSIMELETPFMANIILFTRLLYI